MARQAIEDIYKGDPVLEMRDIQKAFGATVALEGVSFDVYAGEVHALVGENGAGKSTLMKVLSGVHQPDKGSMTLNGQCYRPRHPMEARTRGVGMIYQELSLVPHLSVAENIFLGMEPSRHGIINRARQQEITEEILSVFDHPLLKGQAMVKDLPPGPRQLVEIARSMAMGSRILVFDEPTSSLSRQDTEQFFQLIKRLQNKGIAIVYISHFLEEIFQISNRITVLRDGAAVATHETGTTGEKTIIEEMVGREVEAIYPRSPRKPGTVLLDIKELAAFPTPSGVSMQLHAGEILGVFGLVGSGRTEFLRTLFGLQEVVSGKIVFGQYSGPSTPGERWTQGIGFLSEDRKDEGLAAGMTIADNLTLSNLGGTGPGPFVLPKVQHAQAQQWIGALNIRCLNSGQRIRNLSGGNQQKVALGRLLFHDVDILLLDEPTRGIDVGAKAKIYQVLDDLITRNTNKAIILVSSYLPELMGICDRIAVMCRGKLGQPHQTGKISEHQLMEEAVSQPSQVLEESFSGKK